MTDTLSWSQRRRRLIAYGQWQPWVDAAPIRAHVRQQMNAGLTYKQIAELADVAAGTVSQLLYRHPPTKRIRPVIAARLLAVRALGEPTRDDAA